MCFLQEITRRTRQFAENNRFGADALERARLIGLIRAMKRYKTG